MPRADRIWQRHRATLFPLGMAVLFTVLALVATVVVSFGECIAEGGDQPAPSYPWSPRRRYCQEGTLESLGSLLLLALPGIGIALGTLLKRRGLRASAVLAYALAPLAVLAPTVYVRALPSYPLYETKVFHDPVVMTPPGDSGPRVCMRYGVAFPAQPPERRDPAERRTCVTLEGSVEASALSHGAGGYPPVEAEELARKLSERGAPIHEGPTGLPGFVVTEVRETTLDETGMIDG